MQKNQDRRGQKQIFSADFISGSRDFTQHLTSGVLILLHLADACVLVIFVQIGPRLRLKTLSSLLTSLRPG